MQGKTINGYTLERPLGTGGMAEVWYAENKIGKKAAVKMLLSQLCADEGIKARFFTEAKVMVELDHPNIRQVYDFGDIDGRPTIVMEYLDGMDLKAKLKRGQRFSDDQLVKWWNQLVDALNYTHQKGVVHRDIKPSNIFIDSKGDVKLLDFGIPKVADVSTGTLTGSTLGTRIYMSPEQVKDPKRVGAKSDVYSLAVSFVHLITGKAPYDSTTSSDFDIQVSIVSKPVDLSPLPQAWQDFLAPYLEKDPEKRPALKHFGTSSTEKAQTPVSEETIIGASQPFQATSPVKSVSDDETMLEGAPQPEPVKPQKSVPKPSVSPENTPSVTAPAKESWWLIIPALLSILCGFVYLFPSSTMIVNVLMMILLSIAIVSRMSARQRLSAPEEMDKVKNERLVVFGLMAVTVLFGVWIGYYDRQVFLPPMLLLLYALLGTLYGHRLGFWSSIIAIAALLLLVIHGLFVSKISVILFSVLFFTLFFTLCFENRKEGVAWRLPAMDSNSWKSPLVISMLLMIALIVYDAIRIRYY